MPNAVTSTYQLHRGRHSSHTILAELALQIGRPPVLDVGAAEGYLGQLLAGTGLPIDAIEPEAASAAAAVPYYGTIYHSTVENADLQKSYGTIVCGDVLEHLVDPARVLRQLTRSLEPEGVVLISLPNVVHLAVRLLVAAGRFPRMDRGPLDRTHLHFFTRSTAEDLIADAGLRVVQRAPTTVPLADIFPRAPRRATSLADAAQTTLVRVLPELFAYQWIFAAARVAR
jgi:2-polyprenyl-3-methyl-5-hydroxy-6-metoxy-1,4-benzoquinol methylase